VPIAPAARDYVRMDDRAPVQIVPDDCITLDLDVTTEDRVVDVGLQRSVGKQQHVAVVRHRRSHVVGHAVIEARRQRSGPADCGRRRIGEETAELVVASPGFGTVVHTGLIACGRKRSHDCCHHVQPGITYQTVDLSCFAVFVDHVPAAAQAARTARVSCGVACSGHGL
jgi:hypothetical protein